MMTTQKCTTCGNPAWPSCKQCANCWEVEKRLEDYLLSEKGRAFVENALADSKISASVKEAWVER